MLTQFNALTKLISSNSSDFNGATQIKFNPLFIGFNIGYIELNAEQSLSMESNFDLMDLVALESSKLTSRPCTI